MSALAAYRRRLDVLRGQQQLARAQMAAEAQAVGAAADHWQHLLQAQVVAQEVAQRLQHQAHAQIAQVVTRCLRAVYDDEAYAFRIDFEKKRGKTEARLVFVQDGQVLDPVGNASLGQVDVAAFALRLAALLLARPRRRKLLVLDEPFKWVDRQRRPRVRRLLETLAQEMDVQFFLITHFTDLACGSVIDLE